MVGLESGQFIPEQQPTREQLVEEAGRVLLSYPQRAIPPLRDMVRKGEGKQVLGSVPGRPEDEQLQIDAAGEHILTSVIRGENISPAFVFGEHNDYPLGNGESRIFFAIDSFDNTSQYKRGLDTPPYTVVGAYDQDGNRLGAVIGDIKDRKAYMNINGENFLWDLESGERKKITKSERTTTKDSQITIATYLGSNEYSSNFMRYFSPMIEGMAPKGVLYGGGGSYIYGLMASGAVDAYVMFNEPYSEIFTGLPIALAAGCTAVGVNLETGQIEELKFEPEKIKANPEIYKNGTVPLYIAAATPEIRDEIIKYYLEEKTRIAQGKEKQRLSEKALRFANSMPQEFAIFPDPQS